MGDLGLRAEARPGGPREDTNSKRGRRREEEEGSFVFPYEGAASGYGSEHPRTGRAARLRPHAAPAMPRHLPPCGDRHQRDQRSKSADSKERHLSERQRAHLERARRRLRRCKGYRKDGKPCRMPALRGSRCCLQHDQSEKGQWARLGQGRKSRYQLEQDKFKREGQRVYRAYLAARRRGRTGGSQPENSCSCSRRNASPHSHHRPRTREQDRTSVR
jgi:hypothetical protein